jgi:hypothetical protein
MLEDCGSGEGREGMGEIGEAFAIEPLHRYGVEGPYPLKGRYFVARTASRPGADG